MGEYIKLIEPQFHETINLGLFDQGEVLEQSSFHSGFYMFFRKISSVYPSPKKFEMLRLENVFFLGIYQKPYWLIVNQQAGVKG